MKLNYWECKHCGGFNSITLEECGNCGRGPNGFMPEPSVVVVPEPVNRNEDRTERHVILIAPMGKPRMTRRDKIPKFQSKSVKRYFEYAEKIREVVGAPSGVPDHIEMRFFIAMPKSYSRKKCNELNGKPHRAKPDTDNIIKGVKDSILEDDSGVWSESAKKFWCEQGQERIELELTYYGTKN